MNGNLPDAFDGARWRFERARCGWPHSRGLRRLPILVIPLSARSFAVGDVDQSQRTRFCGEGWSPC